MIGQRRNDRRAAGTPIVSQKENKEPCCGRGSKSGRDRGEQTQKEVESTMTFGSLGTAGKDLSGQFGCPIKYAH